MLLNDKIVRETDLYNDMVIPTYVINLSERTDRLAHIRKQFEHKKEFELILVEACKHEAGTLGLWNSIVKVIKLAIANDDDVIIICEDDHEFTENYSKEHLLQNVIEANEQGVNILSGGIGGFNYAIPVTNSRCWIDSFWCTQFIVIYKNFFQIILEEPFSGKDTADGKFSEMTSSKMVLYPFISVQKDFGYSDVTRINNEFSGQITRYFESANNRLSSVMKTYEKYRNMSSNQ